MLAVDTKYMSPADTVRFVHEFEAVLVDAAVVADRPWLMTSRPR